jgi:hypothetical protein
MISEPQKLEFNGLTMEYRIPIEKWVQFREYLTFCPITDVAKDIIKTASNPRCMKGEEEGYGGIICIKRDTANVIITTIDDGRYNNRMKAVMNQFPNI